MPAIINSKSEPAKMTKVKNVETVRAEVDRLFPAKYLLTSYQAPLLFFAR
jgi:hypothetical protein